jgi:hypothetical protein
MMWEVLTPSTLTCFCGRTLTAGQTPARCCDTRGSRATARRCTRRGATRGPPGAAPIGPPHVEQSALTSSADHPKGMSILRASNLWLHRVRVATLSASLSTHECAVCAVRAIDAAWYM